MKEKTSQKSKEFRVRPIWNVVTTALYSSMLAALVCLIYELGKSMNDEVVMQIVLFSCMFFMSAMTIGLVYAMLSSWVARVTITGSTITKRNLLYTQTMDLDEIQVITKDMNYVTIWRKDRFRNGIQFTLFFGEKSEMMSMIKHLFKEAGNQSMSNCCRNLEIKFNDEEENWYEPFTLYHFLGSI